jgi:uncharacterized protein (TIGR02996 family)
VNQEEAFLQAIIENPEDDAPRLVYADWLDEHGQSGRAGFIRTQIELARLPEGDERQQELRTRAGYLLYKEQLAWRQRLRSGKTELKLVRGFVEGVALSAGAWLQQGKRLLAATPLRTLEVLDMGKHLTRFLAAPTLAPIRRLVLNGNGLGDTGAQALAGCPHLANLAELHLARNAIGEVGAQALAASPHLANLTLLDLSANAVGAEGARVLAGSPHLKRLRVLHLGSNGIGDAGATALAGSANLAGLVELTLFANDIGAAGARALVRSAHLQNVQKLYLDHNKLDKRVRKELAGKWGERVSCGVAKA